MWSKPSSTVRAIALPADALLLPYRDSAYTDCYATDLAFPVTVAELIEAFYTTRLFKLERLLLGAVLRRPSTDVQARELALGRRQVFAAWSVEAREENQAVLAAGRTRSWLAAIPNRSGGTRLCFGSAVVPKHSASAAPSMGFWFRALAGFHRIYSHALLHAARSRLIARSNKGLRPRSLT